MIRRATIIAVGRLRGWAAEGAGDYAARLRRYFSLDVIEIPEADMNRLSPEAVLSAEADRILRRVPDAACVFALDRETGRQASSEELARRLSLLGVSGKSHAAFLLGGPLGLSRNVLSRADDRLSLGPLTLPHALARVVFFEQLYRAVKIERGEKYHW